MGYDAYTVREQIAKAEAEGVIPARGNRCNPPPHDKNKYRWRN